MFYKYLSIQSSYWFIEDLLEGKLTFSCPKNFNDPFDCSFHVDGYLDPPAMIDKVRELSVFARIDPIGFQALAERIVNNPEYQTAELRKIMLAWPVFCMSTKEDSLLMWGHYSSSFKGMTVGLKESTNLWQKAHSEPSLLFRANEVSYSTERPRILIGKEHDLTIAMLTKHIDWKYEAEWRVLGVRSINHQTTWDEKHEIGGKTLYKYEFDPEGVEEVIFGPLAEPAFEELITSTLGIFSHIRFKKLKMHPKDYRLD